MAVAFVAATRAGDGQTSTTDPLSIANASTTVGHVLVLFIDAETSGSALQGGVLSGWNLREGPDSSGNSNSWVFTRTVPSGLGANTSIDFAAAYRDAAVMLAFSGADESLITAALSDVNVQTVATGTYTLPTVPSAPAGAMVVAGFVRRRSGAAGNITVPSPYTSPTNGDAATAYGTGANVFLDTGYALTASGGTVGGEAGSTGVTSIGANYVIVLPAAVTAATVSAALGGTGTLSAAGSAPTVTQGATLGGSGTLAATGVPGYARSAALSGDGTLAATGAVNYTRSAALSGNGTLGALPVQGLIGSAGLDSEGELQAAGLGFSEASLDSTGTLVAFPYQPAVWLDAVLASIGSLSASAGAGFEKVAALAGSGSLSAIGLIAPRVADLSGTGYLSTFGQNALRIGLITPATFRLGTGMPTKMYLGSVLVWSP